MKKLIGLLWISIAVLTISCVGILYYSNNSDTKQKNVSMTKPASTLVQPVDKSILPTVTQPERTTRNPALAADGKKADFKPLTGNGELMTEPAVETSTGEALAGEIQAEQPSGAEEAESVSSSEAGTYEFPEDKYPYRAMLTDVQKRVYDLVYQNAADRNATFGVSGSTISQEGLADVMTAIYNDHPELFWMDSGYSYGYTSSGRIISITLKYNDTLNSFASNSEQFYAAANRIIDEAKKLDGAANQEKYVYDALCSNNVYDEQSALNQSAFSAMVNGRSVCAGYSRAFQYILQELGIPCYFCSGYANGGYHAWNIVKLDDKYYNVDVSWGDSLGELGTGTSYEYYNLSDSKIANDHTRRGLSVKLPACE